MKRQARGGSFFLGKERAFIRGHFSRGSVVCLTGSGISSESGIPTFRGKGGLWEKYDPRIYAYPEGLSALFAKDPQRFVDFISDFYEMLVKATPNPAHASLTVLERRGILSALITQNIDNLHQDAGSRAVIELHGNSFRIRCPGCRATLVLEKERFREMGELLKRSRSSRIRILKILKRYFPLCPHCRQRYRIDIVLFGEQLPREELERAFAAVAACRTLLIVGTSHTVYPVASLPAYAKEKGAQIVEINSRAADFSPLSDYKIQGRARDVLPEIVREIVGDSPSVEGTMPPKRSSVM